MDLNGDGIVDEFESQNQPPVPGEQLPSNGTQTPGEIEMDLNGDGIVDESESQMVEQFENIRNSFIVELKPTAIGSINETLQALTPDLAAAGGTVSAVYDQFGMFGLKFEGPQAEADRFIGTLKEHPAVEAVYNDSIITTQQTTKQVIPNNIDRVDADKSPTKSGDGSGSVDVDIAILDTGVQYDHPDLNVFKCVSFFGSPQDVPLPLCTDTNGHGTHVAGIAAAKDNNIGVVGIAPEARIWAIKISDGASTTANLAIAGLNYVAKHSDEIEVVNLSQDVFLGHNAKRSTRDGKNIFPALEKVIKMVTDKGIVVVVAAGNDNIDVKDQTPARTPEAITVSAITDTDGKCGGAGKPTSAGGTDNQPSSVSNPDDFVASYSNYGAEVDLAAPGTDINSTLPLKIQPKGYGLLSGTSMAAPHVAGAAALYKSLNPTATPAEVYVALLNTAIKAPASGNPLVPCDGNGKGYFNKKYTDPLDNVKGDIYTERLLYMR